MRTWMNILLHYRDKYQCIQAISHGYIFTSSAFTAHKVVIVLWKWCYKVVSHCCMIGINLKSGTALFECEVSLVSLYILQQPFLYCWCPCGSELGDTSCNESLLNADIFSLGYGFGELIKSGVLLLQTTVTPTATAGVQVPHQGPPLLERWASLCSKVIKYFMVQAVLLQQPSPKYANLSVGGDSVK